MKNLIRNILKSSTDGFPNSENAEQILSVKCIGEKLKTIRTNFMKAVDTNKRNDGGRVLLTFYGLCKKLWSVSAAVTSLENLIDTSSSTKQSTESIENNDSKNIESEESNYSDEATERRSKTRKLLNNHKSEKLSSKSGAAMLPRQFKSQKKND